MNWKKQNEEFFAERTLGYDNKTRITLENQDP